jgi:hypothetical protein
VSFFFPRRFCVFCTSPWFNRSLEEIDVELSDYASKCRAIITEAGAQAEKIGKLRVQLLADAESHERKIAERQKQVRRSLSFPTLILIGFLSFFFFVRKKRWTTCISSY